MSSTLVVEKTERIGDVWRNRYHSLQLHNEICMNHFAYIAVPGHLAGLSFPRTSSPIGWSSTPRAMELNVWTKTTFLGGEYDGCDKRWTVRLRVADGSMRTMRPSHVVLAVGVSGIPSMPEFEGMDEFAGPIVHSSGRYR